MAYDAKNPSEMKRLNPHGADGIDAAGREKTGNERSGEQNNQRRAKRDWIARAHLIKQVAQKGCSLFLRYRSTAW
jgi:hypothetical protein